MATDAEPAPHLITIALSAAGLGALQPILAGLPVGLDAAVMVVQHVGEYSELPLVLQRSTRMRVKFADDGELLGRGMVYVCRPGVHTIVRPTRTVALSRAARIRQVRPCADWLMESAAASFGASGSAVILSGRLSDGARGIVWMRKAGAATIAQTPSTCGFSGMPTAAIRTGCVDVVLPPDEIAPALLRAIRRDDRLESLQRWRDPFGCSS